MAYQQQYPLAVASDNFGKPETFELMVFGKLEDGGIYENKKNVTLKGSGMQRVEFDVSFYHVLFNLLSLFACLFVCLSGKLFNRFPT